MRPETVSNVAVKSTNPNSRWHDPSALWILAAGFAICLAVGGVWIHLFFKYGQQVARLNVGGRREVEIYTPLWNEVNRVYYIRIFERGSEIAEGSRFLGAGSLDDNLSDKKFVVHRSRDGETIAISCANTPADVLLVYDFRLNRYLDSFDPAGGGEFVAGLRRVQENVEGLTLRESPDGTI